MEGEKFVTQNELTQVVNNLSNNLIGTANNLQNNQNGLQEQILNLTPKNENKITITFDSDTNESVNKNIINNEQINYQLVSFSVDNNYVRQTHLTRTELNNIVYTKGTFTILDTKNNDNYIIAKILRSSNVDKKNIYKTSETNLKYHVISSGGIFAGFVKINGFHYGESSDGETRYRDYTFS